MKFVAERNIFGHLDHSSRPNDGDVMSVVSTELFNSHASATRMFRSVFTKSIDIGEEYPRVTHMELYNLE